MRRDLRRGVQRSANTESVGRRRRLYPRGRSGSMLEFQISNL